MPLLKNIALLATLAVSQGLCTLTAQAAPEPAAAIGQARQEGAMAMVFTLNRHLSGLDIQVTVEQGTAHLSGKVENEVERQLAGQLALDIEGIGKVDNQLQIDPSLVREAGSRSATARRIEDATLVATVGSRLLWSNVTQAQAIEVTSEDGVVTLKGRAQSPEAKELAGRLASNTDGVSSVNNLISISAADSIASRTQPQALSNTEEQSDEWITSKVKSSLMFSRNLDGLNTRVDTKEGVVTLDGMVANFAEKELAVEIARNIRGVKGVNADALKVTTRSAT